jgi:hypothetical protein
MNKVFDYNGTFVSASKPVRELKTVKKTLLIDSADRDSLKYYTNGDVVYYLPRVYENVVCIRLKSATFTPIAVQNTSPPGGLARVHSYLNGQNIPTATWSSDSSVSTLVNYFLLDIEGLNKCDETTVDAQRSTYVDNYFARITIPKETNASNVTFINYNDNTEEENIGYYTPPIGKLDRLHIVTRLHTQQDKSGFIYFTSDGGVAGANNRIADYSLVFELTMLDNKFDDFSSFESRLATRADGSTGLGAYGC